MHVVRVLFGMAGEVNEQKLGYYYKPYHVLGGFLGLVPVSVQYR